MVIRYGAINEDNEEIDNLIYENEDNVSGISSASLSNYKRILIGKTNA